MLSGTSSRCTAAVALAAAALVHGPGPAPASPRVVLAELFGRSGCPACAPPRAALASLAREFSGDLVWVEYHTDGATPLATADGLSRTAYYGVSAEPTARFDGTEEQVGGSDFEAEYRNRIAARGALPQPLTVAGFFFFDPLSRQGSVVVDLTVDAGVTIPSPGEVTVRALVVEDPTPWCCGPGGESAWPRVARLLVESPLEAAGPGERQSFQIDFPLSPGWDPERLGGLVFVQRDTDRSVLAADSGSVSEELQPVPVTLDDATRVTLLPTFPNPTASRARIHFFLPAADRASLRILNARGRVVRVLTDGPRTRGLHPMTWDGTDWRGRRMAAGIYLVVLETSTARRAQRLALLR